MKKFCIRLFSWSEDEAFYIVSDNFEYALHTFLERFCNGVDYMELEDALVVKWSPVE